MSGELSILKRFPGKKILQPPTRFARLKDYLSDANSQGGSADGLAGH